MKKCRMQFRPDKDFPVLFFWHCFVDGEWVRLFDLLGDHREELAYERGIIDFLKSNL